MQQGDTVIYSLRHYKWLVSAYHPVIKGKPHGNVKRGVLQRDEVRGTIIEVNGNLAEVQWENGRQTPSFLDNLEVVEDSRLLGEFTIRVVD